MDEVDGIVRRMNSHQSHRQGNVVRTGFALDEGEGLQCRLFGVLNFRAGWHANTQRELSRFDIWKNLRAQSPTGKPDDSPGDNQIDRDEQPTNLHEAAQPGGVAFLQFAKKG